MSHTINLLPGQELLSARKAIAQLRVEVRDLTNTVRRELQASPDWARIDTEEESSGETLGLSERFFHKSLWKNLSRNEFIDSYVENEDLRDEIDLLEVEGVNCFYLYEVDPLRDHGS